MIPTYSILDLFFGPSAKRFLGVDLPKRPVTEFAGDVVVTDDEPGKATKVTVQGLKGDLSGLSVIGATELRQESHANAKLRTILGSSTTTTATPLNVLIYTLGDPDVCSVVATVNVTDASAGVIASYRIHALVFRSGGGAFVYGTVNVQAIESNAALDCTISTSGNNLMLLVTGLAANTLRWGWRVEVQRVTF